MKNRILLIVITVSLVILAVSCSASKPISQENSEIPGVSGEAAPLVEEISIEDVIAEAPTEPTVQPLLVSAEQEQYPEIGSRKGSGDDEASSGSLLRVEELQYSFNAVVNHVLPTVVEINVTALEVRQANSFQGWPWFFDSDPYEEYESSRLGSGVIFRKDGKTYYILTNDHVAADAESIEVVLDDERTYQARLVGTDSRRDLAIVSFQTDETDIPVAELGKSGDLKVGDWVLAMGSPFGYVSSVTAGIVSALGRSGRDINNINDFIQTDAAINSGNSGGPLVNIYGEVVGINTWIAAPSGGSIGLGFAIPIDNAKMIVEELIEYGRAVDGWLGISMLDTEQYNALVTEDNQTEAEGVFVGNVYLDSPAYKGGIRAGDIIIGYNGTIGTDIEELSRFISDSPLGTSQEFIILRDDKTYKVSVALEQRKTEDEISSGSDRLWPGILPVELSDDIRTSLGLSNRQNGVMVQFITSAEEANMFREAGMTNYDVITEINGERIDGLSDFYRIISDDSLATYEIRYIREGRTYTAGVEKK